MITPVGLKVSVSIMSSNVNERVPSSKSRLKELKDVRLASGVNC